MSAAPIEISRHLCDSLAALRFSAPVTHVYNPLVYARAPHERYLELFASAPREVVLLGMNPGPWGMAQTGVPFGEVELARDWIGVEAPVARPADEHPKRPILGFECHRSEVSGRRLWGWARDRFGTAERFFARFFVANYCPLIFLEASGRNRTPDRLPVAERRPLLERCDDALRRLIEHFEPRLVIGVGAWAERRAREALDGSGVEIGRVLHPSPASPVANRGWQERAEAELAALGVELPD